MKDARRRARDVVDQFLPISDRVSGEHLGYLTDITVEGGMVQSPEPLEENACYALRVQLTEQIAGSQQLDLDARCVWNHKDRNAVFHHSGCQFIDVDAERKQQIAELAEHYRLQLSR